ncbi:hypothetical protein BDN72DRAFT_834301 [Pluteus cervinus]|uniref:Uncharacterized protein n=1 Tax=Pluteus cervinus TaxID=181527 RepID=A0ACD3B7U4_9AGAR|nr:hypothetical protein BDN72DRAFT_834301 [Pluteus cervinus]
MPTPDPHQIQVLQPTARAPIINPPIVVMFNSTIKCILVLYGLKMFMDFLKRS